MTLPNTNIPALSVENMVNTLSAMYSTAIINKTPIKALPSVMLWGAPGVGKSQGVRQIAKRIERETGKTCKITDVRLLLFNPIDLRGIPTANKDKTLALWLKPEIFQMDPSEDIVNILFLDELSAAPQSVQASAYQLTLDRQVGEHKLPDNCIVLAAGNRVTDKSVAFKMPKALANRLLHLEIEGSFESWKKWAINSQVNKKVIGFLSFKVDSLYGFDADSEDLAFPTPRSWEMVSNILNSEIDEQSAYPLICGLVGSGTATQFTSWIKVYDELPSMEEVFGGRCTKNVKTPSALYAMVTSMVSYAREHRDNILGIGSSLTYAKRFPPEFAALLIESYKMIDADFGDIIKAMPEYFDLIKARGVIKNGYV
ncbi:MAG: AAA family ATPase [Clostridia bacterium]|nr:AAA family ATPase [Clostridia bacterium]